MQECLKLKVMTDRVGKDPVEFFSAAHVEDALHLDIAVRVTKVDIRTCEDLADGNGNLTLPHIERLVSRVDLYDGLQVWVFLTRHSGLWTQAACIVCCKLTLIVPTRNSSS